MSEEDSLNDDELEDSTVDDEEAADDIESVDSESEAAPASGKAEEIEAMDDFSIASRQKARDELEAQIAEFLARGGKINQIEPNVTADPPQKPTSDYGGRPI